MSVGLRAIMGAHRSRPRRGRVATAMVALPVLVACAMARAQPAERDDRLRIGLCVPQDEGDSFWSLFVDLAEEAAADLGVDLVVRSADGARELMREQIAELCAGPQPVDAVLFQNFKKGAPSFFEVTESARIPAFLVNAGLTPEQAGVLGTPRSTMKSWIGEMLPDDEGTGSQLAIELIEAALGARGSADSAEPVRMVALGGIVSDGASIERLAGLRRAVSGRPEALLHQAVAADWSRELARRRCRILLKRYPGVSVVWAANDPMALGALDAAGDLGMTPGVDVFIGGVDGTPEALDAVERGDLVCTFAGHSMEGAWSVVVVHDYLRGVGLGAGPPSMRSSMLVVDRRRVSAYRALLGPEGVRATDFRAMSRHLNPGRAGYTLEIDPGPTPGADGGEDPSKRRD